ncbi:HAD family hydrolase [Rudaeicoccus suwonensis]|uniref:Putative hydrolase of the HAD superfamily n=1 Tax=Rudaeicoccus suwonensis TaxID=657409 RepID=A0A561E9E7_9MICO|nr:HAD family hydrolase [Rudaeicoccus suwonensis]TWE12207.1 putative hydrolase of the HAD superfamily [Rudaeicoccus suwonensis]
MPIRAVLLDIDDTLLDTTTAMVEAGAIAMAAVWPDEDPAWRLTASRRFRSDPGRFFARFTRGELDFERMRRLRLEEVALATGRVLPADGHASYERAYGPAFAASQRLYDDVLPFLARCSAEGIAVAALTNSSQSATDPKLQATGLVGRLGPVVTRDTLGFGKPDPRVFARACDLVEVAPGETAYVGDEFEADVLGSMAAGLAPVWLRRPRSGENAHVPDGGVPDLAAPAGVPVIASLTELELERIPSREDDA